MPASAASSLIRIYRPEPDARLTLFCLSHAGGGASNFRGWAERLQPDIEVAAIQLPGREDRYSELPYDNMQKAVSDVATAIAPWMDKPFAVFGHSFGALLGFELLHELAHNRGRSAECFFVSACRAPHLTVPPPEPLHRLPDPDFLLAMQARYGGIPAALAAEPEFLQALMKAIRADFGIFEEYSYRERGLLSCQIMAIGGTRDANISTDSLKAWSRETSAEFEVKLLNAGHFYLQSHLEELAPVILSRTCCWQQSVLDTSG
jgi:medium-chain acyl-[acyl-carrier-protein] hydrolase